MPTTEAQKQASSRYYQKNRDRLLVVMRQRAKERAETDAIERAEDPKAVEEYREKLMEKYYRGQNKKKKEMIDLWLLDPDLTPTFKNFLRESVLPVIQDVPMSMLKNMWETCAIVKNEVEVDGEN